MVNPDKVVLPAVRWIGQRPRLAAAIFRFADTNPFDPRRITWPYTVYDEISRAVRSSTAGSSKIGRSSVMMKCSPYFARRTSARLASSPSAT